MNKISIYLASGWFTPMSKEILDVLEAILSSRKDVDLYSPRRDGIMLPPNQKHDTALRESIFNENILHIDTADLVFANIDTSDSYNDPGTVYEIGYAMAHNVPVVGFCLDESNLVKRFGSLFHGFDDILMSYEQIPTFLDNYKKIKKPSSHDKVIFVGSGDDKVDTKLASYIMDSGASIRWIQSDHKDLYPRIDEIFDDAKYLLAVVDDRRTVVSWMIGQAYARGIPVITYSDHNYGINVMLLISVWTHLRGTDELQEFLQQVKRGGLESIPKFDVSQLDSM